jgi:flagellar biosynthesis protein FlhF
MRLKLFRAPAMAQAMAQVRAELGEDALILATRRLGDGVEITAALEPDDLPPPSLPPLTPPDSARLAALDFHGVPAALRAALQHGELETALAKAIPFGSLPFGKAPLLLVGPPGAGKTLTVARLATRLLMAGDPPMVITADGKRAGATEQLAAFTRLLGISLIVASHPVTLGRALTRCQNNVPVLVDTPGCDPFDAPKSRNWPRWLRPRAAPWFWSSPPASTRPKRPIRRRPTLLPAPACWWRRGSTWRGALAASWPPPVAG